MSEQLTISDNMSKYVKLNVGGTLYHTTNETLCRHDTMLKAMFSGRLGITKDAEGWVLIDRSGKHFGVILNFLRDGDCQLPSSVIELKELLTEAKYYLISDLILLIQNTLDEKVGSPYLNACQIPLVSNGEDVNIIRACKKPAIKLLINRHNNKFSYTSNSDDNLLRNLEMFDKLAVKFYKKILFIKDINNNQHDTNEICTWYFYGHGKKQAEVCCTSIVYGTDKKHTKVDYPEAKILEETLSILLFEDDSEYRGGSLRLTSQLATGSLDEDDEVSVGACGGTSKVSKKK